MSQSIKKLSNRLSKKLSLQGEIWKKIKLCPEERKQTYNYSIAKESQDLIAIGTQEK